MKRKLRKLMVLFLAASMLVTVAGCTPQAATGAIAQPQYPQMKQYPDAEKLNEDEFMMALSEWRESHAAQLERPEGYADGLGGFFSVSTKQFLSGAGKENRAYSPLSVYMALAMIAELTDGESRAQILNLLGSESAEALRSQAAEIWNANYCDDGIMKSVLANSVWLNENIEFRQSAMDTLAEDYYASSFEGAMGSEELNSRFRNWMNEQTGDLLEEQASKLGLDVETVFALVNTFYFKASWQDKFKKENTGEGVFHADEQDMTCDFMHQSQPAFYYQGENFSASCLNFDSEAQNGMYFLLPEEGISPEDLLSDSEAMELVSGTWPEAEETAIVNFSVPKFDIVSDMRLNEGLSALGVTDVFDPKASDFSPMTDTPEIFVSSAKHAARVKIDEDGCEAAAYTAVFFATGALIEGEEIEFTLDRPFLFVITGADKLPLFVGIVNRPV